MHNRRHRRNRRARRKLSKQFAAIATAIMLGTSVPAQFTVNAVAEESAEQSTTQELHEKKEQVSQEKAEKPEKDEQAKSENIQESQSSVPKQEQETTEKQSNVQPALSENDSSENNESSAKGSIAQSTSKSETENEIKNESQSSEQILETSEDEGKKNQTAQNPKDPSKYGEGTFYSSQKDAKINDDGTITLEDGTITDENGVVLKDKDGNTPSAITIVPGWNQTQEEQETTSGGQGQQTQTGNEEQQGQANPLSGIGVNKEKQQDDNTRNKDVTQPVQKPAKEDPLKDAQEKEKNEQKKQKKILKKKINKKKSKEKLMDKLKKKTTKKSVIKNKKSSKETKKSNYSGSKKSSATQTPTQSTSNSTTNNYTSNNYTPYVPVTGGNPNLPSIGSVYSRISGPSKMTNDYMPRLEEIVKEDKNTLQTLTKQMEEEKETEKKIEDFYEYVDNSLPTGMTREVALLGVEKNPKILQGKKNGVEGTDNKLLTLSEELNYPELKEWLDIFSTEIAIPENSNEEWDLPVSEEKIYSNIPEKTDVADEEESSDVSQQKAENSTESNSAGADTESLDGAAQEKTVSTADNSETELNSTSSESTTETNTSDEIKENTPSETSGEINMTQAETQSTESNTEVKGEELASGTETNSGQVNTSSEKVVTEEEIAKTADAQETQSAQPVPESDKNSISSSDTTAKPEKETEEKAQKSSESEQVQIPKAISNKAEVKDNKAAEVQNGATRISRVTAGLNYKLSECKTKIETIQNNIDAVNQEIYDAEEAIDQSKTERVFDPNNVTVPSNITKEEAQLALEGTYLEYLAPTFVECEKEYGINAIFLMSIAAHESDWGRSRRAIQDHNYTGFGVYSNSATGINATSGQENIRMTAAHLANNYLNPNGKYYHGLSVRAVHTSYCATGGWTAGIITHGSRLIWKVIDSSQAKIDSSNVDTTNNVLKILNSQPDLNSDADNQTQSTDNTVQGQTTENAGQNQVTEQGNQPVTIK